MRTAAAALVLAFSLAASAGAQEPRLRYRLAYGVSPSFDHVDLQWPRSLSISTSADLIARNRIALRVDGIVGSDQGGDGVSGVTLDAVYQRPIWRTVLYPVTGTGFLHGQGLTYVYGAGADFQVRNRPVFTEMRSYRHRLVIMKFGVRF